MIEIPNGAHLHLLVNHFPIIGTMFGSGLLIYGMFFRNETVMNTSYAFFVISAITGAISYFTGGLAANIVIDLTGTNRLALRNHSETAVIAAYGTAVLGSLSLASLVLKYKKRKDKLKIIILIAAIIMTVVFSYVGYTGGQIRHSEEMNIR